MELLKICAFILILLFFCEFLDRYLPGYALLLTLAGGAGVAVVLFQWIIPFAQWLSGLASLSRQGNFDILLKAALIAFVSENVGEICADAGKTALRSLVELSGRCLILLQAVPLFGSVTEIFITLLQSS